MCAAGALPQNCFRPTQDGYPTNLLDPAFASVQNNRVNYLPADTRTAYVMSWHLSVQRELPGGFILDVAYVGNRSNKLVILQDYNEASFNGPGQNLTINARRPIQGFGQIQIGNPAGWARYNALQAKLERRYQAGLYILNTFVYSKAMDNASGHLETSGGDDSRVSRARLASYKGPSGYNQKYNDTFTVVWELPYGRGRRYGASSPAALNLLLGGWNLSQTTTWNTGLPVNLIYSPVSRQQIGTVGNIRANIIGDPVMPSGQADRTQFLNPATVQVVPAAEGNPYGNAGRNTVVAPNYFGTDLGVHKRIPLGGERFQLELRAEFFNLFNHTNFLPPDSNRSNNTYGLISGTFPARQGQLALKFLF